MKGLCEWDGDDEVDRDDMTVGRRGRNISVKWASWVWIWVYVVIIFVVFEEMIILRWTSCFCFKYE